MLEGTKVVVPNSEQGSTDHRGMEDGHGQPSLQPLGYPQRAKGAKELSCFLPSQKDVSKGNAAFDGGLRPTLSVRHRRQSSSRMLQRAA